MKAVVYTKFGPPDVLQLKEVEIPTPKENQVLVKVHAASVNAMDYRRFKKISTLGRFMNEVVIKAINTVLGADVAGTVESVGSKVTEFKHGDEVFGCAHGSFAEYVLARETYLTLKPADRTFEEAAAIPLAALTAIQAIRYAGGIHAGQQVLIHGASGGIGTYALQLAKSSGAEVTAVCSTRNVSMARSLGADHVIDYTKEDFTKSGKQFDLILAVNGYRSLWAYRRALKPKGLYIFVGGAVQQIVEALLFGKWLSKKGGKTLGNMGVTKINQDDLTQASQLLKDGILAPAIDRRFPLHETVNAIQYVIKSHAQGKVVIEVIKG